jgi:prepilin-type N-terminal cleavage/methylation domain-containing protein
MRAPTARRGITLIELLVVIVIFVGLAAMIMAVAPRFGERQAPSRGASQLQSWLSLAKQLALRDQRPRGIRLVPPSGLFDAQYVTELVYIEQPEDFRADSFTIPKIPSRVVVPASLQQSLNPVVPRPAGVPANSPDYSQIRIIDTGNSVPYLPPNPLAPIQVGDIIHITDLYPDKPRRILGVSKPANNPTTVILQLDQWLDAPTRAPWPQADTQTGYIIYRQPRPMAGEPTLQLPKGVGIDISRDPTPNIPATSQAWHRTFPQINSGGGQPFDILFAPSGQVLGPFGASTSRICLWVRDITQDWNTQAQLTQMPPGDNTLITIHTRTGQVTSHPVDPSGLVPNVPNGPKTWDPFRFTYDSKSSGQ